jgi:L-2-hydroxyglutarate oxidase LhgO
LRRRHSGAKILILEKETSVGQHASGRNSGVLHSGIYYGAGTSKARICAQGGRALAEYCLEHGLPLSRCGKVIVPGRESEDAQLDLLRERGQANGVRAELIDERQLSVIEPEANSCTGRALHCLDTAVVDPQAILEHLHQGLGGDGVEVLLGHPAQAIDAGGAVVRSGDRSISFGHLFNAAGLHADRIAEACGAGLRYAMLPFKGIYYRLLPESELRIRGLIYPVPDLRVPFLGVHFTRRIGGEVDVGPTAAPALGRENYEGLEGIRLGEAARIMSRLLGQYVRNRQGFRRFAHGEVLHSLKSRFVAGARNLVPRLCSSHLGGRSKVGIRAQLLDRETHELVMDFVVEHGERSTHVLNAVSPAFTSAFAFARLVADEAGVR